MIHIPVLTDEVLKYLNPKPNENFIDGTIDGGGHTKVLLEKIKPKGKILGIDLDKELLNIAALKFKKEIQEKRLILVNDNFKNLKKIVNTTPNFQKEFGGHCDVSGVLFDLGISLWHLEESGRGFSFKKNEVLDMNYTPQSPDFRVYRLTAKEIVSSWPEREIERILKEYGQERYSRRIARKIIETREKNPILTTFDLVNVIRTCFAEPCFPRSARRIKKAVPRDYERGRIHPATRTFQALRIAVNQELENLKEGLVQGLEVLKQGGRIVVISFHSLEDRIVKIFFKKMAGERKIEIFTKKPVRPSQEEIRVNPKARSAKLRTIEKL